MRIQVRDIAVEYHLEGPEDGSVIMLHHSLATSHAIWDDLTIALAQDNRVLSFDARGHGQTDAPDGPYSFEQLAGDATGLMDALGVKKAHHVGLSMGGMVSQYLGFSASERVSSLTLVSTVGSLPDAARAGWDERLAAVAQDGMAPQVEPTLKRWFTRDYRNDPENAEMMQMIGDLIRNTPVKGYSGWGAAIRNLDFGAQLPKITAPTMVMVGKEDPGTPPAMAEAIYNAIPGAELHVLPDASHMLPLQQTDAFIDALLDFIEDVEENPAAEA